MHGNAGRSFVGLVNHSLQTRVMATVTVMPCWETSSKMRGARPASPRNRWLLELGFHANTSASLNGIGSRRPWTCFCAFAGFLGPQRRELLPTLRSDVLLRDRTAKPLSNGRPSRSWRTSEAASGDRAGGARTHLNLGRFMQKRLEG